MSSIELELKYTGNEKNYLTNQFILMQRKLWFIITWPSAIGTFVFGIWMIVMNPAILLFPWMWLKLIFVGLLALYHLQCHSFFKQQKAGVFKTSSFKLRLFNEIATVFLVAIVFLVIVKSTGGLVWGMLGLFIFVGLLMGGVYIYKNKRTILKGKLFSNSSNTGFAVSVNDTWDPIPVETTF